MKLVFSARARDDLARLREFIAEKNPQAAERVARILLTALQRLVDHPHLGRPVEEIPACRDLVAGVYDVRYRSVEERVEIIRIWHGKEGR
ncbi:MAG: type II toxin-antitoxin system RelE/ParE family toxin [bacterium]